MKIYFEKFGEGRDEANSNVTPNKPYEVINSKGAPRIINDAGTVIFVRLNIINHLTNSVWKLWTPKKGEKNSMKIYFEEFGEGYSVSYLTPWKIYEVIDFADDGWVMIKDDEGEEIGLMLPTDGHTGLSWKILSEEPKTQSAVDIVASLESERNALANSVDSVNELLDSLAVPKAETLAERVKLAVSKEHFTAG